MKAISLLLVMSLPLALIGCAQKTEPTRAAQTKPTTAEEDDEEARIQANMAKLSPADRALAEAQGMCAVNTDKRLGCMGPPAKIMVKGKPVFLCCPPCERLIEDEDATLEIVEELKQYVKELKEEAEME